MRQLKAVWCLVACGLLVWAASGCGGAYDDPLGDAPQQSAGSGDAADKPAPPDEKAEVEAVDPEPDAAKEEKKPKPAAAQKTPPRRPQQQPSGPAVRLSAGVAVPQSLPTGTAMGFSVDYQFAAGRPDPSAAYAWVVESASGRRFAQPANLQSRGTLEGFFLQLRPGDGPFKTYIEDAGGTRLCAPLSLR